MALSEEVIARRLRAVDQSSESIQTTSMWILHHRDLATQFVNCWTEVFRTAVVADDPLQIALFYVANDVCQKAKKKGDSHVLLQAFAPHWISAISYSRGSENVQKAVGRILDIFEERQIYSKSQLADMRAAQSESNELDDNVPVDFDIGYLIRDVEGYHKGNLVMERARELLARSDFNFKDKIKTRMKDRRDGEKFMGEIEQSYTKLTDFFGALAKHRKRGQHLLSEIERAKRCFTLQLRDVTVVEDAYQKFGTGIDEVRAEVEEMLKTSVYPGASPPRDAPSPTANDDPFREGVEIAFRQMRGMQCCSGSLLSLPKVAPTKEDSVVKLETVITGVQYSDSIQTDQSFRDPTHMLKMTEGVRASEISKTNSPSSIVSDPRLASHPPLSSVVGCLSSAESTVASSSFPVLPQTSLSGLALSSGLSRQPQVSQISPFQHVSSAPLPGVAPMQDTQATISNGNPPQWFSASLSTTAPGTTVDVTSISGTTNSLQTPIVSSQLHGNQTASPTVVPPNFGSQPSSLNTSSQIGQPGTLSGISPPPPPNVHPSGAPLLNNFVAATMPPYTVMSATSATIPFPVGSYTVPPLTPTVVPSPNSFNVSSFNVMDCPLRSGFSLSTSSFSPTSPLDSCTFSSPLPSGSNSTTLVSATPLVSRISLANGDDSHSMIDSTKVNGNLRYESRKHVENCNTTSDTRGNRRSIGRFHGGDNINRGGLRDPRERDRDQERNGNRELQQQLHNNGGRRYSSDNRSRVPRYRDYDDDRRYRRSDLPHDDFSRNRR